MNVEGRYRIERHGRRNFAVFDGSELVCVTLYRVGAVEVIRRLSTLDVGSSVSTQEQLTTIPARPERGS
jgi:hypothetical protein